MALVLTPISIASRVRCSCGGEQFFISTGDDVEPGNPLDDPVNNIECVACHQMYLARFEQGEES
jgi:hypothetical protein